MLKNTFSRLFKEALTIFRLNIIPLFPESFLLSEELFVSLLHRNRQDQMKTGQDGMGKFHARNTVAMFSLIF